MMNKDDLVSMVLGCSKYFNTLKSNAKDEKRKLAYDWIGKVGIMTLTLYQRIRLYNNIKGPIQSLFDLSLHIGELYSLDLINKNKEDFMKAPEIEFNKDDNFFYFSRVKRVF